MLRYIADKGLPHKVTLVYSNRDRESTAFLDELQEIDRALPNCRLLLTMTDDPGWDGDTRMLDAAVLREYLGELDGYTFMIAGPPPMVESVAGALRDAGVPEEQVLPDSFSGY